ncbi:hypothetical protein [Aestuariivirga sp.]|uniref:hypothetical protein n=1 Tax=Aestuariivirga sp. TaxID=2650926 RepID=UPI0039E6AEE6
MDTSALVSEAQQLIKLMDAKGVAPLGAVLVRNTETDGWRLWIVPPKPLEDKQQFYAKLSSIIIDNQKDFSLLDAGDLELRQASSPAIQQLGTFARVDGIASVYISGSTFNGFYLPECIVLRMNIDHK